MSRLKVAVMLQPGADGTAAGTREQARYAEQLEGELEIELRDRTVHLRSLDGIFLGDHLKPAGPYPESMVVLLGLTSDGARQRADPLHQRAAIRAPRRAGAYDGSTRCLTRTP